MSLYDNIGKKTVFIFFLSKSQKKQNYIMLFFIAIAIIFCTQRFNRSCHIYIHLNLITAKFFPDFKVNFRN